MPSNTDTALPPLLALPFELRLLILTPLLTSCANNLKISSLFIRDNYVNKFMTQQYIGVVPMLLRVCRQLHLECAPILYSQPLWRASCRLDSLRTQIGSSNFKFIRKLECDSDDLGTIANSLSNVNDRNDLTVFDGGDGKPPSPFLNLELLITEGYQASAVSNYTTRRTRFEAIRLCKVAQCILRCSPNLEILGQKGALSRGRSDAIDTSMGRVKWRFMKRNNEMDEDENLVDLARVIELVEVLLTTHEQKGKDEHGMWKTGEFRQYPHLAKKVTTI